jgi:hypothetical protein
MSAPDLSKPSREGLSYILRHKELWPTDFRWFFPLHSCCAIELANRAWPSEVVYGFGSELFKALGLPVTSMNDNIFINAALYDVQASEVTPEMVADKIDAL